MTGKFRGYLNKFTKEKKNCQERVFAERGIAWYNIERYYTGSERSGRTLLWSRRDCCPNQLHIRYLC